MNQKPEKQKEEKEKKCRCTELEKQIESMQAEVIEYKTKYLRALADYQNYEKRVQDQRQTLITGANKEMVLRLLPFLDNLDKAEVFVKDTSLRLVKDSFHKLLKEEGLKEIEILGKEYDPYNAEVIELVDGEKDNIVVDVLRKGYEYNGQIIRIAQVKVSRKKTQNEN